MGEEKAMRLWLGGPRVLGVRTGISLGREDFRAARLALSSSPRPRSPSCIYVIQDGNGRVKIGISADPIARRDNLQTASASRLKLVYVAAAKSDDAFAVERASHRLLSQYRHEGEWFDISPDVAVAAISAASYRVGDPIQSIPLDKVETVTRLAELTDSAGSASPALRVFLLAVKIIACVIIAAFAALLTVLVSYLVKGTL